MCVLLNLLCVLLCFCVFVHICMCLRVNGSDLRAVSQFVFSLIPLMCDCSSISYKLSVICKMLHLFVTAPEGFSPFSKPFPKSASGICSRVKFKELTPDRFKWDFSQIQFFPEC